MKIAIDLPYEALDEIVTSTLRNIYDIHKREDAEVYSFPLFSLDREENAVKMAELYKSLEVILDYLGEPIEIRTDS